MGVRALITRSAENCRRTAAKLAEVGIEAVELPLSQAVATGAELPDGDFDGIVFTSSVALVMLDKHQARQLRGQTAFCVGSRTADTARSAGFTDVIEGGGSAERLAEKIADHFAGSSAKLLYLAGEQRAFDFAGALAEKAITIVTQTIYRIERLDPGSEAIAAALEKASGGVQLHFSALSAGYFFDLVREYQVGHLSQSMDAIGISPKITKKLPTDLVGAVYTATTAEEKSMIAAIAALHRG